MRRSIWFVSLVALTLLVAACAQPGGGAQPGAPEGGIYGGAPEPTEAPAGEPAEGETEADVVMQDISFQPQEITVEPGTTVTWQNEDNFGHTVTAGTRGTPTDLFDASVSGGETFSFTFEEAGTYEYFCSIHDGMNGVVVVGEGGEAGSSTSSGASEAPGGETDYGGYDYGGGGY